jgi:glycosyltransferase involved in cell wall biosynthesis
MSNINDKLKNASKEQLQPLITLVTPVFNQSNYLEVTMRSVLCQSYSELEYIVIDDGSRDESLSVAKRVAQEFPGRVTVLTQTNIGQAATLNRGWGLARGKYLGYLSSDDVISPNALDKLIRLLESDNNIVCVFPDSDLIDSHGKVVKKNVCQPFSLEELVVRQECYIGPGALFRRDAYDIIGGWDIGLKLAPDREFWIRLAGQGKIEFLSETLAGYRLHPKSISYKDVSEEIGLEYIRVLDKYFNGDYGNPLNSVLDRRDEAYAYATLILARNNLRSGNFRRGMQLYKKACLLNRDFKRFNTKSKLIRNVLSKPARVLWAGMKSLITG